MSFSKPVEEQVVYQETEVDDASLKGLPLELVSEID